MPEGQFDDDVRAAVVEEVTQAVARAEGGAFEDVSPRVWVFPTEIPDGTWGGRGQVRRLPDIVAARAGEQPEISRARGRCKRARAAACQSGEALPGGIDACNAGSADQLPQRVGLLLGHDATRWLMQHLAQLSDLDLEHLALGGVLFRFVTVGARSAGRITCACEKSDGKPQQTSDCQNDHVTPSVIVTRRSALA